MKQTMTKTKAKKTLKAPEDWLTEQQAADFLGIVTRRTLQHWRLHNVEGRPPSFTRPPVEKYIYYRKEDLIKWKKKLEAAS